MKPTLIQERVRDVDIKLMAQPGVFSADAIDPGTRLLIETMRVSPTARVLDLGCGYGAIGIVAAKLAIRGHATLVDSDIRATRLAERNVQLNGLANADVVLGDGVHDLPPKVKYDLVVSNPPTHEGRQVLEEFVAGAYKVLRPRGQMYLVVNRLLSLRREVARVFGNEEIVARSKGYIVVRAVKTPRAREDDELSLPEVATSRSR